MYEPRDAAGNIVPDPQEEEAGPKAVPIEEQTQRLLDHYEKAATAVGEWHNQIPIAIREWGERRHRLSRRPDGWVTRNDAAYLRTRRFERTIDLRNWKSESSEDLPVYIGEATEDV